MLGSLEVGDSIPLRHLCSCVGRCTSPCEFPPAWNISPASNQLVSWALFLNKVGLSLSWPPPIHAYHHASDPGTGCCSTCIVLFNPYHKHGTWFYHYYPDNRDKKTEVSWLFPNRIDNNQNGLPFTNELNIYFMHMCARYYKYSPMRGTDTKAGNYHATHGGSWGGPAPLQNPMSFSPALSYPSLVIQVRACGDLDQCVNGEKPSDSCKEQLIPIILNLL